MSRTTEFILQKENEGCMLYEESGNDYSPEEKKHDEEVKTDGFKSDNKTVRNIRD